jgi:hypothetical protein
LSDCIHITLPLTDHHFRIHVEIGA